MTQALLFDVKPDYPAYWRAREGVELPRRADPTEALPLFLVPPSDRPTGPESVERRAARVREIEAARVAKERRMA